MTMKSNLLMSNNRKQTFYYHLGHEENNNAFQVKVRLRSVASSFISKQSPLSGRNIECTFRWQEKVENPIDCFHTTDPVRSLSVKKLKHHQSEVLNLNATSFPDATRKKQEDETLKRKSTMFIYTYIDKDFQCTGDKSSKDNSSVRNHLSASLHALPRHNLHSSETISTNAIRVHDRLSREDPFQIMYIAAAVDYQGQ